MGLRIMRLVYLILMLIIVIQFAGCGGVMMIGTVVDKNENGISGVDITVKSAKTGKIVLTKLTDKNGVFQAKDLDKHDRYEILASKKIQEIDVIKSYTIEYNLRNMSKEQIKSIKIKPNLMAGAKGRIIGPKLVITEPEQAFNETTESAEIGRTNIQESKTDKGLAPVDGAEVLLIFLQEGSDAKITYIQKRSVVTDPKGNFEINDIKDDGKYLLLILNTNYQHKSVPAENRYYEIRTGAIWDVGDIILELPASDKPIELDLEKKIIIDIGGEPIRPR